MIKIEKQSKPITDVTEGDKVYINGKEMIVDKQFVFIEHKETKEMIIEFYNVENDREYQLRYFADQVEASLEVYELVEDFQYTKREPKTVAW
ncbi:MAG: hypothetical protein ACI83O_000900 [Patescibacteria group bacterium]|jgi:hypothetical protein